MGFVPMKVLCQIYRSKILVILIIFLLILFTRKKTVTDSNETITNNNEILTNKNEILTYSSNLEDTGREAQKEIYAYRNGSIERKKVHTYTYNINSKYCVLPHLNPFSISITKHMKDFGDIDCSSPHDLRIVANLSTAILSGKNIDYVNVNEIVHGDEIGYEYLDKNFVLKPRVAPLLRGRYMNILMKLQIICICLFDVFIYFELINFNSPPQRCLFFPIIFSFYFNYYKTEVSREKDRISFM